VTSRSRLRVLLVAAVVAVVAGVVVVAVGLAQPASSQWFAYAPLSGETVRFTGAHLLSNTTLVGAGVLVAGLVALAFALGVRAGRRGRD